MSFLGLDIGTTMSKGIVISSDCKILAQYSIENSYSKGFEGNVELNSEHVWDNVKRIIGHLSNQTKHDPVEAISVSAMGDTITPVSRDFTPISNSILAFDNRGASEIDKLEKSFGRDWVFQTTGMPVHPMYSAGKILWIRENLLQTFAQTDLFLCYEDLITAKLSGEPVISYASAGRTMLFDIHQNDWNNILLDYCGISEIQLAVPKPSGTPVGVVLPKLVDELGLSENVLVVVGGHDQTCGALGGGIYKSNQLLDSSGTFGILFSAYDQPVLSDAFLEAGLCMYHHAYPGSYCSFGMIPGAGAVFKWFRDQFGEVDRFAASQKNIDAFDEITSHFSKTPSGLYLIPHFSGSGTPHMDPSAKGAVYGLTLSTSKYDFGQAILEGVTYEIKTNIEILETIGKPLDKIESIGGGAKSDYWLQLKANILEKEIQANPFTDLPLLGAAILAGFGNGSFPSIDEVVAHINPAYKKFTPQKNYAKLYREAYQEYKHVREKVAEIQ